MVVKKGKGYMFIKAMSHSTIWIAVLVVHVGCIIEAQPSKNSSPSSSPFSTSSLNSERNSEDDQWIPAESQSTLYTTYGKNSFIHQETLPRRRSSLSRTSSRNNKLPYFSSITTTPTSTSISSAPTTESEEPGLSEQDSCTGKMDGYYQNYGSDCTSYYFCAAGYQITYICPAAQRFTGKKCEENYKCPKKSEYIINPCGNKPNGYYPFPHGSQPGKYFYCFKNAKVIELQCDLGKVFINGKCTLAVEETSMSPNSGGDTKLAKTSANKYLPPTDPSSSSIARIPPSKMTNEDEDESCSAKSNGFYTDKKSDCRKYYYCINGEKTGLSCQPSLIFNGDLCVHSSRYTCPYSSGDYGLE